MSAFIIIRNWSAPDNYVGPFASEAEAEAWLIQDASEFGGGELTGEDVIVPLVTPNEATIHSLSVAMQREG